MTTLTKWTIRPRLMGIAGVANVAVWGEKDPQLQVVVDPVRLNNHGITLDAVLQTVRDATLSVQEVLSTHPINAWHFDTCRQCIRPNN